MNAQKPNPPNSSMPPYVWYKHCDGMLYPATYVEPRRQVWSLLSLGNPLTQKDKRRAAVGLAGYPPNPAAFLMGWLSPEQMNAYVKQSERGDLGFTLPRFAGADLATRQWVMAGLLRFSPEVYGSIDPHLPALLYKAAYVRYSRRRPDQVAALMRGGFDGGMATWWLDARYDALVNALVGDGTDPDAPGGMPSFYEFRKQRSWVGEYDAAYYTKAVLQGATPHYKVAWFSALLDAEYTWTRVKASDVPTARARKDRRDEDRRAYEDLTDFKREVARAKQLINQCHALSGLVADASMTWVTAPLSHDCTWMPVYYQEALKGVWANHPSGYDPKTPKTSNNLRLWERETGQFAPVFSDASPAPVGFWEEYAQSLNPKTPKSTESTESHEPLPAETTEDNEDEIACD